MKSNWLHLKKQTRQFLSLPPFNHKLSNQSSQPCGLSSINEPFVHSLVLLLTLLGHNQFNHLPSIKRMLAVINLYLVYFVSCRYWIRLFFVSGMRRFDVHSLICKGRLVLLVQLFLLCHENFIDGLCEAADCEIVYKQRESSGIKRIELYGQATLRFGRDSFFLSAELGMQSIQYYIAWFFMVLQDDPQET